MQGMDPEIQAFFEKMFAGNSGPAPAGPPGMEGLEGGWSHIPRDPMAFITELLTPQNVQRTTQFAGGSHYGPDRNKSIPAQNFAQAEALLNMMMKKDAHERSSEMGGLADDTMRRRVEAERTNLSPGSITMGGETMDVQGKIGGSAPMGDAERSLLEAGGYPDTRQRSGYGYGGEVDPSKQKTADVKEFEAAAEYLGQLIELQNRAETPEQRAQYDAEISNLRGFLSSRFGEGGGPGGGAPAAAPYEDPGVLGTAGNYYGEKASQFSDWIFDPNTWRKEPPPARTIPGNKPRG